MCLENRKSWAFGLFVAVFLSACGEARLSLLSNDIVPDKAVPAAQLFGVGCSGANSSPHLRWSGAVPSAVKSYVITVVNRSESNAVHWLIYDLPISESSLATGIVELPQGATFGPNDFGTVPFGYRGPCALGAASEVIEFKIWALEVANLSELTGVSLVSPASILAALEESAVISGSFQALAVGL